MNYNKLKIFTLFPLIMISSFANTEYEIGRRNDNNGSSITRNISINTVPVLTIKKNLNISIGETPNYMEGVTAIDAEDGYLTSHVRVNTSGVDTSRVGTYIINYSVVDSLGNIASKNRIINVNNRNGLPLKDIENRLSAYTENYTTNINRTRSSNKIKRYDLLTELPKHLEYSTNIPNKNRSLIGNNDLKIEIDKKDTIIKNGFGISSNTTMFYNISNKGYRKLTGTFGIDKNLSRIDKTSMKLNIKADGLVIYEGRLIDSINPTETFSVDISGKSTLTFEIKDVGGKKSNNIGALVNTKLHFGEISVKGVTYSQIQKIISQKGLKIPDLDNIFFDSNFDPNKLVAYHNIRVLNKYDGRTNLVKGNKIDLKDKLNIEPLNTIKYKKGYRLAKYLTVDNINTFNRLVLFYGDESIEVRNVSYEKLSNGVAVYSMNGIQTENNLKIIDIHSMEVQALKTKLDMYSFDNVLESLDGRRIEKDKISYIKNGEKIVEDIDLYQLDDKWNHLKRDTLDMALTILSSVSNPKTIINNKSDLDYYLFAYTYFEKWYGFNIGQFNGADIIFYQNKLFESDSQIAPAFLISKFKNCNKENLEASKIGTYFHYFKGVDYGSYIESLIHKLEHREDYADWFNENFNGLVYEKNLDVPLAGVNWRAWDNLKDNVSSDKGDYLALALAYKGNSLAFASTAGTLMISDLSIYGCNTKEEVKRYRPTIKKYFDLSVEYYNTMFRVTGKEDQTLGKVNPNFDTLRSINPNDQRQTGINQFFLPLGAVTNHTSEVEINPNEYMFYLGDNMWSIYGYSMWTHELTFNKDRHLIGMEDYTKGLYEHEFGSNWGMNLGEEKELNTTTYTNYSPDRFTNGIEFQEYFKRANDLMMVINILEVDYLATQDVAAQARAFNKYNYGSMSSNNQGDYDYTKEYYTALTEEELLTMNIQSIDDVIENKLELFRKDKVQNSNKGKNDYDKASLTTGYTYFPFSTHSNGRVSSEFFKRICFLLFGNYDYEKGCLNYVSNDTKSSSEIEVLKYITNDENVTAESFNKSIYHEVQNRMNKEGLSVYSLDELKQMISLAYEKDEANNSFSNIKNLRLKVWLDFKKATNEFQNDIFGDALSTKSLVIRDSEKSYDESQNR
ncbi:MAG: ZmpA/ZmpB/ZmpC family metallo-endopeptidase [Psychrilyobacter sp.]|uniref:ZmpA/ZmpB/ZmpC family metallo-endopeptidase n=1 Tax=Psychrilyobacter sp. TaxID=2586924 RepID=UPI003C717F0B